MITRYQNRAIEKIWNKNNQINTWLKIELLVLKYWQQQNLFSPKIFQEMQKLTCNFERLIAIEKKTQHEIVAFVEMLSEQLSPQAGKWIHYGLTSNDILDTSQNYLLKQSCTLIIGQLKNVLKVLKKRAYQEKNTISIGRTHGVHAEPITIGFKFALWFHELQNHLWRIENSQMEINYSKILGPTGVSAHFPLTLNKFVAQKLKMKAIPIATQVISRDRLINLFNTLTNLTTSIEKMAIEIRNLSRSEINEMNEGFSHQQKGSSAMPHKKNPILSENICGLARYLRAITKSFYNTNLLWHERDLSNSSIERIAIPDALHLVMTILTSFSNVLNNLQINHVQIQTNLTQAKKTIFSHRVLLTLIAKSNLNRIKAYQLVQKASFLTTSEQNSFKTNLKQLGIDQHLTKQELDACFDYQCFTQQMNAIFKEVFESNE